MTLLQYPSIVLPPIVAAGTVTDSLGRKWNPLLHPRGRDGKFIHTGKLIRAFLNSTDVDSWMTGEVTQINPDGSVRVKITATTDPSLVDPTTNLPYVGHQVDVTGDMVESVNEKAKLDLDIYGKPKLPGAGQFIEKYDFSEPELKNFYQRAGLNVADVKASWGPLQGLEKYKAGTPNGFTGKAKYEAALYAKSISGEGREFSHDDYTGLLRELGVDPDIIDDTPDGMSGLQYLADEVNGGRSPNNTKLDSENWLKEAPPTTEGTIREATLNGNDGVRLAWFDDGTQGFINEDGSIEKYKPTPDKSLTLAAHDRAAGKADLGEVEGDKPPEPDELDVAPSDFDTADLRDVADQLEVSGSEYGDDFAIALRNIAEALDDDKIDTNEARAQIWTVLDDLENEILEAEEDENGLLESKLQGAHDDLHAAGSKLYGAPKTKLDLDLDVPPEPEELIDFDEDATDLSPDIHPDDIPPPPPEPWRESHTGLSQEDFSQEELDAIDTYTSDLSEDINEMLRAGVDIEAENPNLYDSVDWLRHAMARSKTNKELTVWRGMELADQSHPLTQLFESLEVGDVYTDKSFMSTSLNKQVADQFGVNDADIAAEDHGAVQIEFMLPEGTHAIDVDAAANPGHDTEEEILLPENSHFEVVEKEKLGPNSYRLKVRALTQAEMAGEFPEGVIVQKATLDDTVGPTPDGGEPDGQQEEVPQGNDSGGAPGGVPSADDVDGPEPDPSDQGEGPQEDTPGTSGEVATTEHTELEGGPITDGEREALESYTGVGFIDINNFYRNGAKDEDLHPGIATDIAGMESLAARSKLNANTTVYRGLKREDFKPEKWEELFGDIEDLETFSDAGFLSTTTNSHIADQFAHGGEDPEGVIFEIEVPAGHSVIDPALLKKTDGPESNFGISESELILGHGTKLRVDSVEQESGGWRVYASVTYNVPESEVEDVNLDGDVAPSDPLDSLAEEIAPEASQKFEVLDDPGESGDGYYATTDGSKLWGKYGAAGVMVRHVDDDGVERFLMVQRGTWVSSNVGKWQLPGGALNSNENDYQGTARELNEELQSPDGWLDNLTPTGQVLFNHPSGWHYNNIAADAPEQFEPTVDGTETGDAGWFTREEVENLPLHPALAKNLDALFGEFPEKLQAPKIDSIGKSKVGSKSNLDENGKRINPLLDDDGIFIPIKSGDSDPAEQYGPDPVDGDSLNEATKWAYDRSVELKDVTKKHIIGMTPQHFFEGVAGIEDEDHAADMLRKGAKSLEDQGAPKLASKMRKWADVLDGGETPAPEPDELDTPTEPDVIDATKWSKVGGQSGSNIGGTYEDENGKQYYVKKGKTEDHARNEALAAALYEAAGVPASRQLLAETPFGGLGTVSPLIKNAKPDLNQHLNDEGYLDELRDGFAVDAWLANWDVAGLVYDNVVSDEFGNPVRVDPGGALYFRAQGAPKGGAFGNEVGEIDTLRNPSMNPQSSKIFGDMTDEQIAESAKIVLAISPDQIDDIVDSVGFGGGVIDAEEMKEVLKARRKNLAERFGLTLPEDEDPDQIGFEDAPVVDEEIALQKADDAADFPPSSEMKGEPIVTAKGETIGYSSNDEVFTDLDTESADQKMADAVLSYSLNNVMINKMLRTDNPTLATSPDSTVGLLDTLMQHSHTKQNMQVNRTVQGEEDDQHIQDLLNAQPGDVIHDKAYSGATTDKYKPTLPYGNTSPTKKRVHLKINVPEGSRAVYVPHVKLRLSKKSYWPNASENELILDRDGDFEVVSVEAGDDQTAAVITVNYKERDLDASEVEDTAAEADIEITTDEVDAKLDEITYWSDLENLLNNLDGYKEDFEEPYPDGSYINLPDGWKLEYQDGWSLYNPDGDVVDAYSDWVDEESMYDSITTARNNYDIAKFESGASPLAPLADWEKELLGWTKNPTTGEWDAPELEDSLPGPSSDDFQNMFDDIGEYRWGASEKKLRIGDTVYWSTKGHDVEIVKFEPNNKGVIVWNPETNKKHAIHRLKLEKNEAPVEPSTPTAAPAAHTMHPGTTFIHPNSGDVLEKWDDGSWVPKKGGGYLTDDEVDSLDNIVFTPPEYTIQGTTDPMNPEMFQEDIGAFRVAAMDGKLKHGDYLDIGDDNRIQYAHVGDEQYIHVINEMGPISPPLNLYNNDSNDVAHAAWKALGIDYNQFQDEDNSVIDTSVRVKVNEIVPDPPEASSLWATWVDASLENIINELDKNGHTTESDAFMELREKYSTGDIDDKMLGDEAQAYADYTNNLDVNLKKALEKLGNKLGSIDHGNDPVPDPNAAPTPLSHDLVDVWVTEDFKNSLLGFLDANKTNGDWLILKDGDKTYKLVYQATDKTYHIESPTGEDLGHIGWQEIDDDVGLSVDIIQNVVGAHDQQTGPEFGDDPLVWDLTDQIAAEHMSVNDALVQMRNWINEGKLPPDSTIDFFAPGGQKYQLKYVMDTGPGPEYIGLYHPETDAELASWLKGSVSWNMSTNDLVEDVLTEINDWEQDNPSLDLPNGIVDYDNEDATPFIQAMLNGSMAGTLAPDAVIEFNNGYKLVHDDDVDKIHLITPDGASLASWSVAQSDADTISQDMHYFIQKDLDVKAADAAASGAPAFDSYEELAKINDIPKMVPGAKSVLGPGVSEYQAKQYRNAGYALTDAADFEVGSPEWNKAVNKAIYNLEQAGPFPAAQAKLAQVKEWKNKSLGAPTAPAAAVVTHKLPPGYGDLPDGWKPFAMGGASGTIAVLDPSGNVWYYYSSDDDPLNATATYAKTVEELKNSENWTAFGEGFDVAAGGDLVFGGGYASAPAGSKTLSLGSVSKSIYVQHPDGKAYSYKPNGTIESTAHSPEFYSSQAEKASIMGYLPYTGPGATDSSATISPATSPVQMPAGFAQPPPGAKPFAIHLDGDIIMVEHPDGTAWRYNDNGTAKQATFGDLQYWKNALGGQWYKPYPDPSVTPIPTVKTGPSMLGSNGEPMHIGDKVKSLTDGKIYTVFGFQNNDIGVIIKDEYGNKKIRHRLKLNLASNEQSQAHNAADTSVVAPKKATDPTSPWFEKPKPEKPAKPAQLENIQYVDPSWLDKADANYKKRMKSKNASWTEKPLSSSSTYGQYQAVMNGSTSELDALLSGGRITPELHADALKQIKEASQSIKKREDAYLVEYQQWQDDYKAWAKANGTPAITLKGMSGGDVKEMSNAGAKKYFDDHYRPINLTSDAKNAAENQKGSNISGTLRNVLKEQSINDEVVYASAKGSTYKAMDKGMNQAPALKEDWIFHRTFDTRAFFDYETGMQFSQSAQIQNIVGTIQRDWGYSEMSPGSSSGYTIGNVRMRLRVPKGTRGIWTGHSSDYFGAEGERGWIAERGIAYYIHSVSWDGYHWIVDAEMIPKDVGYDEFGHFVNQNPFFD